LAVTLGPPHHQADNQAQRKCGGEGRHGTISDKRFEAVFLFAQGLAELIQRGLDLTDKSLSAVLRRAEGLIACLAEEA